MTGLVDRLRGAVSFIHDPTPRRQPITVFANPRIVDFKVGQPDDGGYQARFYERLIRRVWLGAAWLDPIEWPTLDELDAKHPRSSPARLRPYDWQAEHSWPVEGWVLS